MKNFQFLVKVAVEVGDDTPVEVLNKIEFELGAVAEKVVEVYRSTEVTDYSVKVKQSVGWEGLLKAFAELENSDWGSDPLVSILTTDNHREKIEILHRALDILVMGLNDDYAQVEYHLSNGVEVNGEIVADAGSVAWIRVVMGP